jgi:hypothetical protein
MWNEPNLEQFFLGSPQVYVRDVLRVGAQAARDADSSALVLGPDLAQLRSAHWPVWLYTVLREAGDAIDIVTHHAYEDSGLEVLWRLGAHGPLPRWRTARGIMELSGVGDKALWLTETGWRTDRVSEEQQADYYVQVLMGVDALPWLDKVFFYEIVDDPRSLKEWGILRSDLTPKAAYYRYQDYIAAHSPSGAPARGE